MTEKNPIQITLTPDQQAQVKHATGKEVTRLTLQALEPRLAPGKLFN